MTTGLGGDRNDEDMHAASDSTGWLACEHQGDTHLTEPLALLAHCAGALQEGLEVFGSNSP